MQDHPPKLMFIQANGRKYAVCGDTRKQPPPPPSGNGTLIVVLTAFATACAGLMAYALLVAL